MHFNQGGRVESKDGTLISSRTPLAGDMDACMPPTGRVRPGQSLGASWAASYQQSEASGCAGEFSLQARARYSADLKRIVRFESEVVTPARELAELIEIRRD